MTEAAHHVDAPIYGAKSHPNFQEYATMYRASMEDPDTFWATQARKFIHWFHDFDHVQQVNLRVLLRPASVTRLG
jgi:acetyl-CoA synthetase